MEQLGEGQGRGKQDQRYLPTRFPFAKIRERHCQESNPARLGGRRVDCITVVPRDVKDTRRDVREREREEESNGRALTGRRRRYLHVLPVFKSPAPDHCQLFSLEGRIPLPLARNLRARKLCARDSNPAARRAEEQGGGERTQHCPRVQQVRCLSHGTADCTDVELHRLQLTSYYSLTLWGQGMSERVGETGDPRENSPTSGIVRHDSHTRKSGSYPAGNRTRFALVRGGSSLTTTQPRPPTELVFS
ncbi:hypothetical protein PR048_023321 [Dryococelus australis]|uniref:Uncharacterized protein n=1 Tax=Dryococelus australis TaxID=614101 RepID=A0ABQ9GTS1_9NEOP|nr:hypothetical protein PR048_023321 [Dryococelus australis]